MRIEHGDCRDVMKWLIDEGVQVDSVACDPPYELGFMGKSWDNTGIAYRVEVWDLARQLLKPGGHLVAFGGSRTYHRLACAIEDAGFEIRDQIQWIYASGFPKSLNVSKAIDKAAGAERELIRTPMGPTGNKYAKGLGDDRPWMQKAAEVGYHEHAGNQPVTDAAKQWDGWGSAIKPSHEPIVLARAPLSEKTIVENVLKHGTGALNIDGCRVATDNDTSRTQRGTTKAWEGGAFSGERVNGGSELGRYPANLIHDGSDEVLEAFAAFGTSKSPASEKNYARAKDAAIYTMENGSNRFRQGAYTHVQAYNDSGTAARFFFAAKASKSERMGSCHPTVKPLSLMRYLVRLITPPGGIVLDPFAGSGTTLLAAREEGFDAIGIELEAEYIADIRRRLGLD